jgi:hypothetical protein
MTRYRIEITLDCGFGLADVECRALYILLAEEFRATLGSSRSFMFNHNIQKDRVK